MSSLTVEEDQKWLPTHVQVTVLRGRGLRGKGKHGTSDVYTIIQLGKEKYSTGVAEKTTEPEWREECSFELQPGVLESGAGCRELVLTLMHRALIGMDVFLGQAVIFLDRVFHESRGVKNQWFRLNSKTGKKEKERGDIQVSVQFTRNNLTASMYDLVMKDKSASTFSKLKDHMRGKRKSSDKDSSSAILPSGYGSLYRMRQRMPSDGGGEEEYEDDEGGEARRSKMRTFFLRGKLRKSSDTRSSTSLASESSESSSRGGSLSPTAGISVVVSDLSNSPSNSSNLTADNSPEHTANTSSSLQCEYGDEAGEITIAVPQHTVCVNGSHAYNVQPLDPGSGKPADSLGLGLLSQKSLPHSVSLQNLSPRAPTDLSVGLAGEGRRWSFDKPGEEEKAAIAAALEKNGLMLNEEEEQLGQDTLCKAESLSSASTAELEIQGKKQRRNLFSNGRSESAGKSQNQSKDESEWLPAATEEKHRGWFGSKDSHNKPSLVVSTKLDATTVLHPPSLPPHPHPSVPPVDPGPLVSTLHHTNPFSHSQTTPPPISPCNPFFPLLQHNPFYDNILTTQHIKHSPPPLPYLSSSRPPIAQLFPQTSNPKSAPTHDKTTVNSIGTNAYIDLMAKTRKRRLPGTPPEEKNGLLRKSSNPFLSFENLELESEWDESFEAFAAGRLQSPEDLTADCKTQQKTSSDHPLEHCNNKGVSLPAMTEDQTMNVKREQEHQPFSFEKLTITSQKTHPNTDRLDNLLDKIPEHKSFEKEDTHLNASTNFANPSACTETKPDINATNDLIITNIHQAPCRTSSAQVNNSSPDPSSSGLGSSADEDFLSGLSSHSDKFSASSPEDTESNMGFTKCCESSVVEKPSISEDDIAEGSTDLSLEDVYQTVIQPWNSGRSRTDCEGTSTLHSHMQPVISLEEIGTESANSQTLGVSTVVDPDLFPKAFTLQPTSVVPSECDNQSEDKSIDGTDGSLADFPNDSKGSLKNSPNITTTPDGSPTCTLPSFYITTSSPNANHSVHAKQNFHMKFSNFSNLFDFSNTANSPSLKDFDNPLISNQSSLQKLNVSWDSQHYQTCESQQLSKCASVSESNQRLHSADSMLFGDLSEVKTSSSDSAQQSRSSNQSYRFEDSLCAVPDKTVTVEPNPTIEVLPAALTASYRKISGGSVENSVSGEKFLKYPQPQEAMLHRSLSEGTLSPVFDRPPLSSFGSDPGGMKKSFLAQPDPVPPSLTSFTPPLTSERSGSPLALCTLLPLANASARLPNGAEQVATPKPMSPETAQQQQAAKRQTSPHPVKPLTTAIVTEEKRSVLATGLEKLKLTISPGRSSQITEQEADRKKSLTEGAGSYYHLTHSELVALLVQREAEIARKKDEFERQKLLLAKREVELRKLKPQVKDLEDYIDTLLVRIMEQKPTLLQVRSKFK